MRCSRRTAPGAASGAAEGASEDSGILASTRGVRVLGLGLSISIDELAIGFTIGLLHLPVAVVVIAVGVQAFVFSQLGLRLGARLGARAGERAERLAGAALVALAGFLLAETLV